ncbi:hypothetical protein D1AOALGA4SA_4433 [Olavius algarvensis Delta 1 endosymbiont]|nr:hypothetical protein D1AOALGA4SA_4433 [Olavius algarvensis Delta 1 endosymbiont]
MSHWMFNCQETSKKVSKSMDQNLPLPERMMIAAHLWMCKYCRRLKDQMLMLRNALRLTDLAGEDKDRSPTLPSAARRRIELSIKKLYSDSVE